MYGIGFYVKAFISLLVLVNPLEGIPVFLAGTAAADQGVRKSTAKRTSVAVTIILLVSLILGDEILMLFSISVGAFQIGGGIVLFLIALRMFFSTASPKPETMKEMPPGFAIVPLAIPLLGGPGAITGAVLYGTRADSVLDFVILSVVIMLVGVATYASLRAASVLARRLDGTGIGIATSIMGLIVAAIAVEMVTHGVALLFGLPALHG